MVVCMFPTSLDLLDSVQYGWSNASLLCCSSSAAGCQLLVAFSSCSWITVMLTCVTSYFMQQLHSLINTAAEPIYSPSRYKHVIPLLRQLHWLKALRQIDFKLSVCPYKCLHSFTQLSVLACRCLRRVSPGCLTVNSWHSSVISHIITDCPSRAPFHCWWPGISDRCCSCHSVCLSTSSHNLF